MFIKLWLKIQTILLTQQKNLQFKRELSLKPIAANAELISSQNTKGRKSAIKIVKKKNGS